MEKKTFQKWQVRKLLFWFLAVIIFGGVYLTYTCWDLYNDKASEEYYWQSAMNDDAQVPEHITQISKNATHVKVGTYVETLKEINMKSSSYRVVTKVWFKWTGDDDLDMINNFHVYNGTVNKLNVMKDEVINGEHYQVATLDVSVFKNFWTKRFPLESHQLRFYIEPDYSIERVVLEGDMENCAVNPNLSIAGYDLLRSDCANYTNVYNTTYGEPGIKEALATSEFMTQMELNRDSFGAYLKCFIALVGTSLWVFITMILCTFHRVDPLGMIPAALFGTVTNIAVGANLLPDALHTGLLEYVNIWGIFTILVGALTIININRIRNKYNDNRFAVLYGRIITFTVIFMVLLGHILMPMSAYMA